MSQLVPDVGTPGRLTAPGWLAALALLTGVRLGVAGFTPLSPDEAYYWVWSRALAPGYLDHPPMVALWIRAGAWLAGEGAFGIRLLGPLSAALGSVLLAQAAADLLPGRGAGPRAAALLNATLLLGVGAVTMTPDAPLLLFWTAALWALARLLRTGRGAWWLAVGAACGLALASKYTAALLGVGIALWLLHPSQRRWLATPWPWAGGALALLLFAPVIAWNARNGWAGFAKQGGRVGDWAPGRALTFLGELLGGQVGLATPLVFAFGNLVMPLQIGSPDVAFPRLNAFSYWLYLFGASTAVAGFIAPGGAADFGWYAYQPLANIQNSPGSGADLWIIGLAISGLGTILGGVRAFPGALRSLFAGENTGKLVLEV